MRGVARHCFTLFSVISLLLFVAVCVVWVRSYYVRDFRILSMDAYGTERLWISGEGRFGFGQAVVDPASGRRMAWSRRPHYYIEWAAGCGSLPFAWLLAWAVRRERSRRNPHSCPSCGYDLRASPERCPECGVTATATK
jgi:hypothetical protein